MLFKEIVIFYALPHCGGKSLLNPSHTSVSLTVRLSNRPSVRLSACTSAAPTGRICVKYVMRNFMKGCQKLQN